MERTGQTESYLLEKMGEIGYDVLDAIVQANLSIERLSFEELERIVTAFRVRRSAPGAGGK